MASPNDTYLCNGIPVDHRLKRFLPNAKQKHSYGFGNHANIIETFGKTIVRDDGTTPTENEVGFATWLAEPDMAGGLVIALQQPAKSQVFTADVESVRDECATLAYLNKSLDFVNGPGGLKTTSVFDAFPFIFQQISPNELSNDAKRAYNTFLDMIEAKRPEVLFACWRIPDHNKLSFSGKGPGKTGRVHGLKFPNGHVVRVVNGFHPSYAVNYCPNESRFRRLFAVELCKAFCELNTVWQEEAWMYYLRERCQKKTGQLMEEQIRDSEQLNTGTGRELRGNNLDNTAKKYKAYTKSFDNGLDSVRQIFEHMVSSAYAYQSSWDLYNFLVFDQNTSEGICDALLAVSEAMKQFAPGTSMPESALVELGKHISKETLKFVKDDIPDLVQYQRGLHKNLWSNRYLTSTSRGLKWSLEMITIRFIEDLTKSFPRSSKGWTYIPEFVHEAFKKLAVSFEDALGREYDGRPWAAAASPASGSTIPIASVNRLSISISQSAASATLATKTTPSRHPSSDQCHNCYLYGHWSAKCPYPEKRSTTPYKSPSNTSCRNCGKIGHWKKDCQSPQKGNISPPRSSGSFPSRKCYACGQPGHLSRYCPRNRQGSATPSKPPSNPRCDNCGKIGHLPNNCRNR